MFLSVWVFVYLKKQNKLCLLLDVFYINIIFTLERENLHYLNILLSHLSKKSSSLCE